MELNLFSLVALGLMVLACALIITRRTPAAVTLLITNLAVFVLELLSPIRIGALGSEGTAVALREYPAVMGELGLFGTAFAAGSPWAFVQVFSSMFIHADFFHLLSNALPLFVFGLPFEEKIGPRKFLAIYLATGIVAAVVQMATQWGAPILMMGASGAIFGILGAFASRFPRQVVPVPVPIFIVIFIRMRIVYGALIYAVIQVAYIQFSDGASGVAYFAHLGGLVAGLALGRVIGVPGSARWQVDLSKFRPLATTPPAKEVVAHMEQNHDEPEVFQAWLDRFFKHATCPTCQSKVMPKDQGHVICTQGHRFDVRKA